MSITTTLRDEVKYELEELKNIELGSDQYKATVEGVTKLMDRVIEMDKFDTEMQEKTESREIENNLKLEQIRDERKDRRTKNWLTVAGIAIPSALTIWGTIKSINFEKEGTITTIMGRGFISKLLPKK